MCENITTGYCFHRNERGSSPSVSTSIKADVWRFAQYSRVKCKVICRTAKAWPNVSHAAAGR